MVDSTDPQTGSGLLQILVRLEEERSDAMKYFWAMLMLCGLVGCSGEAGKVMDQHVRKELSLPPAPDPLDEAIKQNRIAMRQLFLMILEDKRQQASTLCGTVRREHLATKENGLAEYCREIYKELAHMQADIDTRFPVGGK